MRVGLRQVALSGTFVGGQLRITNFEWFGDELIRVTNNALVKDECGAFQFYPDTIHFHG